jgi:hypothetical protein
MGPFSTAFGLRGLSHREGLYLCLFFLKIGYKNTVRLCCTQSTVVPLSHINTPNSSLPHPTLIGHKNNIGMSTCQHGDFKVFTKGKQKLPRKKIKTGKITDHPYTYVSPVYKDLGSEACVKLI